MQNFINYLKGKDILIFGVLVSLIIIFLGIGVYSQIQINKLETKYQKEVSLLKKEKVQKIENLRQNILNRLKSCESGGLELSDAPMILDSNSEISIGLFMFQRDTIVYYYKKLYGKDITRREAVEIAISEKARSLAEDIIFEETGGIFNWKNCARKEGLVGEITIIKKLQ